VSNPLDLHLMTKAGLRDAVNAAVGGGWGPKATAEVEALLASHGRSLRGGRAKQRRRDNPNAVAAMDAFNEAWVSTQPASYPWDLGSGGRDWTRAVRLASMSRINHEQADTVQRLKRAAWLYLKQHAAGETLDASKPPTFAVFVGLAQQMLQAEADIAAGRNRPLPPTTGRQGALAALAAMKEDHNGQ
jgi:hypothetical protein